MRILPVFLLTLLQVSVIAQTSVDQSLEELLRQARTNFIQVRDSARSMTHGDTLYTTRFQVRGASNPYIYVGDSRTNKGSSRVPVGIFYSATIARNLTKEQSDAAVYEWVEKFRRLLGLDSIVEEESGCFGLRRTAVTNKEFVATVFTNSKGVDSFCFEVHFSLGKK